MKKIIVLLSLALYVSGTYAQVEERKESQTLNQEWKQAMEEVEDALKNIEMPDIDVDKIMDDVKRAMPTREEMDSYKEVISDAVKELKKIDLSELESALQDLQIELNDIFGHKDHSDKIGSRRI
jgi:Tfp pilus assembly protein PilO